MRGFVKSTQRSASPLMSGQSERIICDCFVHSHQSFCRSPCFIQGSMYHAASSFSIATSIGTHTVVSIASSPPHVLSYASTFYSSFSRTLVEDCFVALLPRRMNVCFMTYRDLHISIALMSDERCGTLLYNRLYRSFISLCIFRTVREGLPSC